ncbi:MAG: hypothetical protein HY275_16070 [Gemmatimonadetes bacterium]|nr:hypothetical protein [Gemmatimonadota bacterium]
MMRPRMRALIRFVLVACVLGGLRPASAGAQAPSPSRCAADSAYHPFDFWVGAWVVEDSAGHFLGKDEVAPIAEGCAFMETWHDVANWEGRSLFYYTLGDRRWRQVWVTPQANAPSGYIEKRRIGTLPNGAVRFQGEFQGATGIVLNRTTLTPLPDRRVRQVIELSRDGGTTWLRAFDAFYRPATGSGPGSR